MSAPDDGPRYVPAQHTPEGFDNKAPASLAPQPKVVAGGVAGALGVLLVWVAYLFGIDVPDPVAAAVVVILGSGAAYWKKP